MNTKNVAVLGLFNSGSSAIAGVLDKLGVDMGSPFLHEHYESLRLQEQIKNWWTLPDFVEQVDRSHRIMVYTRWLNYQKQQGAAAIGIKHPLLCLSGDELIEAWGKDTKFIWAYRPLKDSILGLTKRAWYADPERIQKYLWEAANEFFDRTEHLRVECDDLRQNTSNEVKRIIQYLDLLVDEQQIQNAISFVLPNGIEEAK